MGDTIFALATAPGRAAVAVVRFSGPTARAVLEALGVARIEPRRASLRTLRDSRGEALDRALVLWFPSPGSYTGEDAAELHLHGGQAVVEGVMAALATAGARLAEPGEFTRRAFENGKVDLEQAEAIADLVDARGAAQARQALAQLDGALGRRHRAWRDGLLDAAASLEAAVDFPDEEIPPEVGAQARAPMLDLLADLDAAIADGVRGRRIREGYRIAIVGAPNAGKSSLFNGLVGRDAVIVTPTPGTTRDVIEAEISLAGYSLTIADMAGLRKAADPIEAEGVRRARAWAEAADLRLWVIDQAASDGGWSEGAALVRSGDVCVLNKADLPISSTGGAAAKVAESLGLEIVRTSLMNGGAVILLRQLETRMVRELAGGDFPAVTRARHEISLREAREHLARALSPDIAPELAAEDVRLAARSLARVVGVVAPEDVLGRVFAAFCIGK